MNAAPLPPDDTAHPPLKAPPPVFNARCLACWLMASVLVLIVASFISLDLKWAQVFSLESLRRMGRFVSELLVPATDMKFLVRLIVASAETLAMSALGTVLAAVFGLLLFGSYRLRRALMG